MVVLQTFVLVCFVVIGCIGIVMVREVPDRHRPLGKALLLFGVAASVVGWAGVIWVAYRMYELARP